MIIVAFFLIGELCHTSGFIDIPTVPQYNISGMYGGGLTFSFPFTTNDPDPTDDEKPDPMDFTMVFRYGLAGRAEISLAMYTPVTYALSFSYLITPEKNNNPAFFCGVDDISYNTHLSTIGMQGETGFIEEKNYHLKCNGRPWELFSTYIAMQKSFAPVFNLVVGLGRGRFVGYGPRSHIFNTDLFVLGEEYMTRSHSWWAFGIFFGGSIKAGPVELIAEIDGRDGNAGIKYHHKYFTGTLAITKCEHFWSPEPFSPRFTLGVEATNRALMEGPRVGSIECVIRDYTSKQPLVGAVIDIKEMNKRYKTKGSTFSLSLPVGNYTIAISKPNYEDYMAKISVKKGMKSKLIFNLKKTEEGRKKELALLEKEKNIKASFEKGKIYYSEGNLNEAKAAFQAVLSLDPSHKGAQDYLAKIEPRRKELISVYSAEARSRTQAKDYAKAIEFWNKVLGLDPANSEAKTAVANLKKKMAPPKKPSGGTKPPVAKKPTKAEINALYKKGVSYFTSEKYSEALKIFKQVLALDPNHAGAKDYKKRTEARLKILQGGG